MLFKIFRGNRYTVCGTVCPDDDSIESKSTGVNKITKESGVPQTLLLSFICEKCWTFLFGYFRMCFKCGKTLEKIMLQLRSVIKMMVEVQTIVDFVIF